MDISDSLQKLFLEKRPKYFLIRKYCSSHLFTSLFWNLILRNLFIIFRRPLWACRSCSRDLQQRAGPGLQHSQRIRGSQSGRSRLKESVYKYNNNNWSFVDSLFFSNYQRRINRKVSKRDECFFDWQRLTFDKWSLLIQLQGRDVPVNVKVKKSGGFEATVDVDGETRVLDIDDNFTLSDSVIDSRINGQNAAIIQLVTIRRTLN